MTSPRTSIPSRIQALQRILGSRPAALCIYGALVLVLAYVVNRAMAPGGMTFDTVHQLNQATGQIPYDDWHPVIMSAGWGLLIDLTGQPAALATVQIGFAAVCAWLTCWYLYDRSGSFRIGLLGLMLLTAPHAVNIIGAIWKDTQMGLAYYAGTILLLFANRRGRRAWIWGVAAVPFFVYGTLVRKNAIVALIPLLIWLAVILFTNAQVRAWIRGRLLRAAACTAAVFGLFAVLLLGGGAAVDAAVKPAHNSQFTQVMLDDLLFAVPQEAIDSSSAPQQLKDKIRSARPICREKHAVWNAYWLCWNRGADGKAFTEIADKDAVVALWKEVLPHHIPGYIDYRAETYAKFLFTSHLQFSDMHPNAQAQGLDWRHPRLHKAMELYILNMGFAQLPWLYHAWFWLATSTLGGLILIRRWRTHIPELALFASAWIYLVSYIPVVPSQDYRYSYWAALAVTLAGILLIARHWPAVRHRLRRRS